MSAELAESSIDEKRVLKIIPPRKVRSKKRGEIRPQKIPVDFSSIDAPGTRDRLYI
jgi:hypothetical protein